MMKRMKNAWRRLTYGMVASSARAVFLGLFLLFLPGPAARAVVPGKPLDQFVMEQWNTDTGLPQNSVSCFKQTRDGYLWFGTQEGLVRFDGTRFTVFDPSNTPEMFNRNVYCIYEDTDGTLWIGIGGGVLRYRDGGFKFLQEKDALTDVQSILRARDGTLWISSFSGVSRIAPGKEEIETIPAKNLKGRFTRRFFEDREGNLFAAMMTGVSVWKNGEFVPVGPPEIFEKNAVTGFAQTADGTIWMGLSERGLVRYRGGVFNPVSEKEGLIGEFVSALHVDPAGTLWVGTTKGLHRLTENGFERFSVEEKLGTSKVLAIETDREGSLWVGLDAVGLFRLRDGKFRTIGPNSGLGGEIAFSLMGTRSGEAWVVTEQGLFRRRDGKWLKVVSTEQLQGVSSLLEGADGTIWISATTGLWKFSGETLSKFELPGKDKPTAIRQTFITRDGTMWMTTENGLHILKDGVLKHYLDFGIPKNIGFNGYANDFHELSDGTLLLSSFNGILRIRAGNVEFLKPPEIAPMRNFFQDSQGVLWIASLNGLWRFDDGNFKKIGTREGLFDSTAWTIQEDEAGYFWMSCNKGIYRVPRADLMAVADGRAKTVRCTTYGTADGMKNRECNGGSPGGWRFPNGEIWFPTVKGVAVINPAEIRTNPVPPPVVVERFTVDGRDVPCNGYSDIDPGTLKVAFDYAGLSLVSADRVRYRYKLEGFDPEWVEAGTRRMAYYTNLPPGNYTFKVMACNNDGVWNETGATLSFRLRPFFHQTLLFYGLCGIGLLSLGGAGYGLRVRGLKARERKLVRLVNERTRALREEKEKLTDAYQVIQADNERKTQELEEARKIQLSLLPKNLPVVPNLDIAAYMKTATEVGGDYYDFHVGDDGTLTVAIGDATGHGLQAGMMVTATKSLFAMLAGEPNLAATFDVSNAVLKKMKLRPLCMALTMAKLQGNRLDVCAAGMPPLFVFRASTGMVEEVLIEAVPLGSLNRPEYRPQPVMLHSGDAVLFSSDGFAERLNRSGEIFGYDRARAAFREAAKNPATRIVEMLVAEEERWSDGHPPDDDVTFIVLKIT